MKNDAAIRFATKKDAGLVLRFIRELAEYEKLLHEVEATEATLCETLFHENATAEVFNLGSGAPASNKELLETVQKYTGKMNTEMHDNRAGDPAYLVADIEQAVSEAKNEGAEAAVPPMEIPGRGKCAILFYGSIQSGLWQV